MPRIIAIVGIVDRPYATRLWRFMEMALREQGFQGEFILERHFYWPWQKSRIQHFARTILTTQDNGKPVLLLGYSLGGVIAQHLAHQFIQSPVIGVVSFCSPLAFAPLWKLHLPQTTSFPRFNIMGMTDFFVPFPLGYAHIVNTRLSWWNHLFSFIVFKKPAQTVAKYVMLILNCHRDSLNMEHTHEL